MLFEKREEGKGSIKKMVFADYFFCELPFLFLLSALLLRLAFLFLRGHVVPHRMRNFFMVYNRAGEIFLAKFLHAPFFLKIFVAHRLFFEFRFF